MRYPDRFIAVDPDDLPWTQSQTSVGVKGIHYKSIIQESGSGLPHVHYNRYDPHWTEPRHRHTEDEVLILVAGELLVEGNRYSAPSVLYVGRHTLYGPLKAGPDGAEFYRVAFSEKLLQLPQRPENAEAVHSSDDFGTAED